MYFTEGNDRRTNISQCCGLLTSFKVLSAVPGVSASKFAETLPPFKKQAALFVQSSVTPRCQLWLTTYLHSPAATWANVRTLGCTCGGAGAEGRLSEKSKMKLPHFIKAPSFPIEAPEPTGRSSLWSLSLEQTQEKVTKSVSTAREQGKRCFVHLLSLIHRYRGPPSPGLPRQTAGGEAFIVPTLSKQEKGRSIPIILRKNPFHPFHPERILNT